MSHKVSECASAVHTESRVGLVVTPALRFMITAIQIISVLIYAGLHDSVLLQWRSRAT